VVGDGDDGEHSQAMLIQATMCEGRSHCKWRPFARNDGMVSGGYRAKLQLERIWEEPSGGSWLATKVMVKILSRRPTVWI
jgi:hypothetical protein